LGKKRLGTVRCYKRGKSKSPREEMLAGAPNPLGRCARGARQGTECGLRAHPLPTPQRVGHPKLAQRAEPVRPPKFMERSLGSAARRARIRRERKNRAAPVGMTGLGWQAALYLRKKQIPRFARDDNESTFLAVFGANVGRARGFSCRGRRGRARRRAARCGCARR